MTMVGGVSLGVVVLAVVASVRGWIPQRVLTLQALLLLVSAAIVTMAAASGGLVSLGAVLSSTSLHPVTATVAGFLFAGALQAAGAFEAAGLLLRRVTRTPLGTPFAVVLLVNVPAIFAMPCGRILAAPLLPLAVSLGAAAAGAAPNPTVTAMVVFGLIVNAAASCGPSLIGGIGLVGEGMGRFPAGSFATPAQLGILVMTVATMAAIRFTYGRGLSVRAQPPAPSREVPEHGYLALAIFVALLLVVVLLRPPVTLQTLLVGGTLAVAALARLRMQDLLGSILLHPLSAMLAGFIVAGALAVSGGFAALESVLVAVAERTPLGYEGTAVLLIFVPLMVAMPCGRIVSVSLIPGVILFGDRVAAATGQALATPIVVSSFILAAAASCGPSPLGGIGSIGEGRLRTTGFQSGRPQTVGILAGVPVSALAISWFGLSTSATDAAMVALCIGVGAACGLTTNRLLGFRAYHTGGLLAGALVGLMVAVL